MKITKKESRGLKICLAIILTRSTLPSRNTSEFFQVNRYPNTVMRVRPVRSISLLHQKKKKKENVLLAVKSQKPVKQIFKEQFDSDHPPRDSKMIQNIKDKITRENNPGHRQNSTDDIQAILNLTTVPNSFVREIVQTAGKPPNSICCTDNRLKHLKKTCKTSVICIDRTFNLGACFVTTAIFQDRN